MARRLIGVALVVTISFAASATAPGAPTWTAPVTAINRTNSATATSASVRAR